MGGAYRDEIRLEVRKAYYAYDAARQQVEVAHGTIAQADESLRINQNRYDSGLNTVSDLLKWKRPRIVPRPTTGRRFTAANQPRRRGAGNCNTFATLSGGDAMIQKSMDVAQLFLRHSSELAGWFKRMQQRQAARHSASRTYAMLRC
jgi:hypothetical protein